MTTKRPPMFRNPASYAEDMTQLYETHPRDVEAIATYLKRNHPQLTRVYEPCYGKGAIADVLVCHGFEMTVTRDKYTLAESHDFLTDELPFPFQYNITITNTPFTKKIEFFNRLVETNKPFAAIFPVDIICRLRKHKVSGVHILIPAQNMVFVRDGKRQEIGQQCCWFLGNFERHRGQLTLEYLH